MRYFGGKPPLPAVVCSIALVALSSVVAAQEAELIESGSAMRYIDNSADPGLGLAWTLPDFDDNAWTVGAYGVGYQSGTGAEALIRAAVPIGTSSVYTRATFNVGNLAAIDSLHLGADYDDGIVVWINGVEVYRAPEMPEDALSWNTVAANRNSSNGLYPDYGPLVDISAALPVLVPGENVMAVGVWNSSPTSSDLVVVPYLVSNLAVEVTRRPYIQNVTPTSAILRWRTANPQTSFVVYGVSQTEFDTEASPQLTQDHSITLTGLAPDTQYFYAIGSQGNLLLGTNEKYSFRTAPVPGTPKATRLWMVGDSGTGNSRARNVRDQYRAFADDRPADVVMLLGDNAYIDGTDEEYQSNQFDIFAELWRNHPIWSTFGNHDAFSADSTTQSGAYYEIFDLPRFGEGGGVPSGTEAYYSFDWANIHIVVLDSEDSDAGPGSAMLTWLEQDLGATVQDWIVAVWHHPPYSKGGHNSDTETKLRDMRENVMPILEDYGVDFTFTGHSHNYERSFLIDSHYGLSTTFDASMLLDGGDGKRRGDGAYNKPSAGLAPHEGAVHVVAGSVGQITGGALDHPAMYYGINESGSVLLDVNGLVADLLFIDRFGNHLDELRLVKGPVPGPPVADFLVDPVVGRAPLAVMFEDATTNQPIEWHWDFENDGSYDSQGSSGVHMYETPGIYSVSQLAGNVVAFDSETKQDLICVAGEEPGALDTFRHAAKFLGWFWTTPPGPYSADVLRGDLLELRASGGSFAGLSLECVSSDFEGSFLISEEPAEGEMHFYLLRTKDCVGGVGSFDTFSPTQIAPRALDGNSPCD